MVVRRTAIRSGGSLRVVWFATMHVGTLTCCALLVVTVLTHALKVR